MAQRDDGAAFEAARPMLLGLAYRILGSRAEAEDAVQDTYLKWQDADRSAIENPASWLTTTCTRRSIDLLRSARQTRVDYVGAWLPEPIHTSAEHRPDEHLALASSLQTAFLLVLERLTPKERAAYLLHEIFDVSYPEIAAALDLQESTCRKLVSRARASIDQSRVRHVTPPDRQEQLLAAFQTAVTSGGTEDLAALLSDDIELCADGGGKVPTVLHVLRGKAEVLDFIGRALREYWRAYAWDAADINGGRGVILRRDGAATACVSFAYDEHGAATNIYIMRNPDKLSRLSGEA
ncbi:RNA polymerase sigma24 factor [Sorangium cellulosum]|uniref:RNA polymerase sigma24 factor n=1 Tax=Sorangium cellulosum TaxID=56 RepID=A0A2L0FB99_SORCE|nr:RNA polymerase sigma factor SigJ [Sorangium cellulosum]AUX48875.1 RNA polymerase sigma24 factor [Sorangium cellulosum]